MNHTEQGHENEDRKSGYIYDQESQGFHRPNPLRLECHVVPVIAVLLNAHVSYLASQAR